MKFVLFLTIAVLHLHLTLAARQKRVRVLDSQEKVDAYLSANIRGKLALLLDYDGTLAPFASVPQDAKMPAATQHMMEQIATKPDVTVAIVSGRRLGDVKEVVGINGITYAGDHGFEIEQPGDVTPFVHPEAAAYRTDIDALYGILVQQVQAINDACRAERHQNDDYSDDDDDYPDETEEDRAKRKGAWVEWKTFSLTVHYRNLAENWRGLLINTVTNTIQNSRLNPRPGEMTVEARLPIPWNKGTACVHILERIYGDEWYNEVRVIFVGDDNTDEDAMEALQDYENAVTFRVKNENIPTYASKRLPDIPSVATLLSWVARSY